MINWKDKTRFYIGDTPFRCYDWIFGSQQSTPEEYFLQKDASMARGYESLIGKVRPRNIFELGIWQGGSCVFFNELARQDKLVAIELDEQRIGALDGYIVDRGMENTVVPHYGVDQSDMDTLSAIFESEFGEKQLDLVIDDASHFIDETRTAFNLLFPRLRAGGVYVIEDWAWTHDPVDNADAAVNLYPAREPLSRLVFEIILAAGSSRSLIEKVEVDHHMVVHRGSEEVDFNKFDIASCYLSRGDAMLARHMNETI